MNNFVKIAQLNRELIYRKFTLFYEQNSWIYRFDRDKFYEFMNIDREQNFSMYVEYLFFLKKKIDGERD